MKHIKTFEGKIPGGKSNKKMTYEYADKDVSDKIGIVAREFVKNRNIPEKIEKLKFSDFVFYGFYYIDILESFITDRIYGPNNIYYFIDEFCNKNNLNVSTPEIRNTIFELIETIYKELNIKSEFNKKLIELLEKSPTKYKERFHNYDNLINDNVKNACKWMLDAEKYNI